jgi:hypothetical protein
MATIGEKVKAILEETFSWVAGSTVTYVKPSGGTYLLNAIVADEIQRLRREGIEVNEAGVVDRDTKRFLFSTEELQDKGVHPLDVAGHFLFGSARYDFVKNEPTLEDITPMADVLNTLVMVYVRRAQEIEQTITPGEGEGEPVAYDGWTP